MPEIHGHHVQVWGVANATPDSFSDGGELPQAATLKTRLDTWRELVEGVDVGAQSTRPGAAPVTEAEERSRLETVLLPLLPTWPGSIKLSLDSFHPATLEWMLPRVPAHVGLVWNDVSGQLDAPVVELLTRHPRLEYVYCHNPVTRRELAGEHMAHTVGGDILGQMELSFTRAAGFFHSLGVAQRVYLDPCFGFGKTREQNHQLLGALPGLMDRSGWRRWVWGVSRKSFLRFPADQDPRDPVVRAQLDGLQLLWAAQALGRLMEKHTVVLRVHDPAPLRALRAWFQMPHLS